MSALIVFLDLATPRDARVRLARTVYVLVELLEELDRSQTRNEMEVIH